MSPALLGLASQMHQAYIYEVFCIYKAGTRAGVHWPETGWCHQLLCCANKCPHSRFRGPPWPDSSLPPPFAVFIRAFLLLFKHTKPGTASGPLHFLPTLLPAQNVLPPDDFHGLLPSFRSGLRCCLSSVHSFSRVRLFVTPWTAALQASLSITNSRSLLKRVSIKSVMPSNHLILCRPLLLLPLIFPSIRVFSNELAVRMRWPKCWSFSFSISPSKEHPRLISFRMDWLDLHAVQGPLKSLLQYHSSKASIPQRSAFLMVQLSDGAEPLSLLTSTHPILSLSSLNSIYLHRTHPLTYAIFMGLFLYGLPPPLEY